MPADSPPDPRMANCASYWALPPPTSFAKVSTSCGALGFGDTAASHDLPPNLGISHLSSSAHTSSIECATSIAPKHPVAKSFGNTSSCPSRMRGAPRAVLPTRVFESRPLRRFNSIAQILPLEKTQTSGIPLRIPKRLYCANCCAVSTVTPAGYGAHIAGGARHRLSKSRHATWMSRSLGSGALSLNRANGGVGVPSLLAERRAPRPFVCVYVPLSPLPCSDPAGSPGLFKPAAGHYRLRLRRPRFRRRAMMRPPLSGPRTGPVLPPGSGLQSAISVCAPCGACRDRRACRRLSMGGEGEVWEI